MRMVLFRARAAAVGAVLALLQAAQAATWYVSTNGNDFAAGTNWATAKQTIQAAINRAGSHDTVLVSNGVYATGGRVVYGAMTNRIAITKPITVQSVNGPEVTIILGAWHPGTTNGDTAIRCAYVTNGAVLAGFTLTNGATRTSGDGDRERSGGGAWCEPDGILSNCMLSGNAASYQGGGSYNGILNNCTLSGNSAAYDGGGSHNGILNNCTLSGNSASYNGGGSYSSTLNNCTLSGNSAVTGGGTYQGTMNNCTLTGNSASSGGGSCEGMLNGCTLTGNSADEGGGSYVGTLNNCTLSGNSAHDSGGGSYVGTLNNCTLSGNSAFSGGGSFYSTLNNCIVFYNAGNFGPNYIGSTFLHSCTTPDPGGMSNITVDPMLASASHVAVESPCIGRGSGAYASGTDIDGEAWGNPPSMGCDEVVSGSITGGLAVSASADYTNGAVGFAVQFRAEISGRATASAWLWGDGTVSSNQPYAIHAFASGGVYAVVLKACNEDYPLGVSATVTVQVAQQAIHYVRVDGPTPVWPFTSWDTAATNIQDAIDAASQGGALVLVSNGVYATGGRDVYSALTNRIAITKPITVQSVNGPAFTILRGVRHPGTTNGNTAVRCAYVANGAVLAGFTLTNGATRSSLLSYREGIAGGAWCEPGGILSNCTLSGNSAFYDGGGSYQGTLNNCTLSGNSADDGGGSYQGTLNNCTLSGNSADDDGGGSNEGTLNNCTLSGNSAHNRGGGSYIGTLNNCTLSGNSAVYGGGSYYGTLNNCIVFYNTGHFGTNYVGSTFLYSCTTPDPGGTGNITDEPMLASASHLALWSPCIGRGSGAYASGTDIDGEAWGNPPSMGCDEVVSGSINGELAVSASAEYTAAVVGFAVRFRADVSGRATASAWLWGDGTVSSNQPHAIHAFASGGVYAVVLKAYNEDYPLGVSATVTVQVAQQAIHYVRVDGLTPVSPFTSWDTAATNIQDAIDAASQGGALVLVSNGVYATGGRVVYSALTNRIAITKPITVLSVNGPDVTIIRGAWDPSTTNGDWAVRCAYVANGAVLSGFTLTNGATGFSTDYRELTAGGAWCEPGGVLSNCTLSGNSAFNGGGSYYGTLNNCTLSGNSADDGGGSYEGTLNNCTLSGNLADDGGGSYEGTLNNCTLSGNSARGGGGSFASTLNNCTLSGNSALGGGGINGGILNNCTLSGNSASHGGGSAAGILNNCKLLDNSASSDGGGSFLSTLNNCTLSGNSASYGGGAFAGTLNNCIVYYNTAPTGANWRAATLSYCCTTPMPSGTGNITNEPMFVATNELRLTAGSPCINRGGNASVVGTADLDGLPRVAGGVVDMGAYEYQGEGLTGFPLWVFQHGLPMDGSADLGDPDEDGIATDGEYAADTDPTNAASRLAFLGIGPTDTVVRVEWQGGVAAEQCIEFTEELLATGTLWQALLTNVPPTAVNANFLMDPAGATSGFFRIRAVRGE
jgi:parallel beta-helix repeat protein